MSQLFRHSLLLVSLCCCLSAKAATDIELQYLKDAYPATIQDVSSKAINWQDGSSMPVSGSNSFFSKISRFFRRNDAMEAGISIRDLQCDSYEPFFKKMYGGSLSSVRKNLVTVYWMPKVFGKRYPLLITTVNGVDKKIQRISAELEKLPPSYYKFLDHPGGSFYWRNVKNEKYLSAHSFGIAMDINSHYGSYWLWDREKSRNTGVKLAYHNNIPMKIVEIFEQEGFLWGGRWYFYDTMHFEYRPELFTHLPGIGLAYHNQLGQRCEV
ncbi:MAG: M15 family metallopeptidase [Gammaproteobacteria bacterium]|nr:M15 family metallopeptidase [Gammaproteobacteria bacterium]